MIFMCVLACKKAKTEPPKVEFDFDEMPENQEVKKGIHVNDLENLFTIEEKSELESYLNDLEKYKNIKILVLTVPSKEVLDKQWEITSSSLVNEGIIITFGESIKNIDIGFKKGTDKTFIKEVCGTIVQQIIIPEFNKGNYYAGIKNGIDEIVDKESVNELQ